MLYTSVLLLCYSGMVHVYALHFENGMFACIYVCTYSYMSITIPVLKAGHPCILCWFMCALIHHISCVYIVLHLFQLQSTIVDMLKQTSTHRFLSSECIRLYLILPAFILQPLNTKLFSAFAYNVTCLAAEWRALVGKKCVYTYM